MPSDADQTRANFSRWFRRSLILIACSASFALGWWVNNRRLKDRVCEEGLRRFQEFICFADELGIIDRERLDELVAAGKVGGDAPSRR